MVKAKNIKEFTQKALPKVDLDTDILFPTNGRWQSLLCKIWTVRNRKKLVISGQSGPGRDDRINLWTFPDAFIALTDSQELWSKKACPFVKVLKIPNGVDLKKFSPQVKKTHSNLPKPIILCVAALNSPKRLNLIINAVSNMSQGSLMLVGKGEDEKKLKDLGRQLLPGRFEIFSAAHDQMPDVYRTADVFTFATVPWESFGIVLLEAMACGLPVVTTDDPIRREIVGPAGIFVDVTDRHAYSIALDQALNKKRGNLPRQQAEKFSWDKIALQYEELFISLVRR